MEKVGRILGKVIPTEGKPAPQSTSNSAGTNSEHRSLSSRQTAVRRPVVADSIEQQGQLAEPESTKVGSEAEHRFASSTIRRRRIGVRTDLTKVKAILSKVLSHRGLDKKVERYEFVLRWPEIVGVRLAEVSKPECIRNRALIVNVIHPVWAQELTMIKPVLLESLAKYLKPGDIVQDMVFRVQDPRQIQR